MNSNDLSTKEKIMLAIQTYNKYSKIYAEYTSVKLLQFQLAKYVSLLPEKGKVLDAGCGAGRDSDYLAEEGLDVVSVDLSDGMIEEAKKNNVNAINMDLLNLELSPESFDGVWCMATLADIPKTEANNFFNNMKKILKREGVLYIAVKEGDGESLIEKERYGNMPRFYAFYKKKELEDLLLSNGFEIIELVQSNDEGTEWLEVFARKL